METKGYGQHIQNQINDWPVKRPITTKEVTLALTAAFDIGMEDAQKVTNVNMRRLVDRGVLARIHHGIYGKVRDTQFGKITPRPDDIMTDFLLREGESVIGYIAGPTLLNALGLCTQIPADRHIATNRYRYRLPKDTRIVCASWNTSIYEWSSSPSRRRNSLAAFASSYYKKTLLRTIDITLGGKGH